MPTRDYFLGRDQAARTKTTKCESQCYLKCIGFYIFWEEGVTLSVCSGSDTRRFRNSRFELGDFLHGQNVRGHAPLKVASANAHVRLVGIGRIPQGSMEVSTHDCAEKARQYTNMHMYIQHCTCQCHNFAGRRHHEARHVPCVA